MGMSDGPAVVRHSRVADDGQVAHIYHTSEWAVQIVTAQDISDEGAHALVGFLARVGHIHMALLSVQSGPTDTTLDDLPVVESEQEDAAIRAAQDRLRSKP